MTPTTDRRPSTVAGDVLVEASSLQLGYGSRTVLDGVDLTIRAGEFWCLVGPNGEGKTTFLRSLLRPRARRGGTLTVHTPRAELGYVPQRCDLNPTLPTTVHEFVALGLVGITAKRREQQQRLAAALAQVGLEAKEHASYWSLSGGQRQRALVARALVRRPRLLLLDEPTSGLDLSAETALLESLAELNRSGGVTIVCVVHNLGVAARYASHVALFHSGDVVADRRDRVLTGTVLRRAYGADVTAALAAESRVARDASGS